MTIDSIVSTAVTILSPYVAAGAKKAAEVAGAAFAEKIGQLLGRIRTWFAGDDEATSALVRFEKNPSRYGGVIEDLLREKIRDDPELAGELETSLRAMGPSVGVMQKIENLAGVAVGLDTERWKKGLAVVKQDVTTIEKGGTLVGARIRKGDNRH